jgi:polyisoprenoid-binding protein YceI
LAAVINQGEARLTKKSLFPAAMMVVAAAVAFAQAPPATPPAKDAKAKEPPPATMGGRLEIASATVTYRSQEQLAGVNFPNDAVGSTNTVTGTLVIAKDGMIDPSQSKLSVDLRTFKSDQDLRDNYLRTRTFEVEKFPMAEFVPKRAVGLPHPLPSAGQAGFQLIGDLTIHGTTKEVTWTVVTTFAPALIAGRGKTYITFEQFALPKPQLARLLSVDDKVDLEIEFRTKRTPL